MAPYLQFLYIYMSKDDAKLQHIDLYEEIMKGVG